ncbi:hypothetical protein IVR12_02296 (plasmid) [Limosilactobacillus reuteri]|nr:hypothetical protein IVR12_02296 [Limosilactobacillus reuteri]
MLFTIIFMLILALSTVVFGFIYGLLYEYRKPLVRLVLIILYLPTALITNALSFIGKRI